MLSIHNVQKNSFFTAASKVIVGLLLCSVFFAPLSGLVPTAKAVDASQADAGSTGGGGALSDSAVAAAGKAAADKVVADKAAQDAKTNALSDASCGVTTMSGLGLCVSSFVYVFTVGFMGIVAYIGSYIFNISVQLTLQSVTYSQLFLTQTWTAVRDLANMVFIFLLVYLAIIIVLKAETSGTFKLLAGIIVCALLINFSFFITRIVIDAGNILAIQFYNAIDAPPFAQTMQSSTAASIVGNVPGNNSTIKDLTSNIMNLLGVQTLLSGGSFASGFAKEGGFFTNMIVFSFVYIAVGAILAMLAFTFLTVGIKFLIRIVVLWFVIISSPLAFVAKVLFNSKLQTDAAGLYKKWQSALIQNAFYPAVFLFIFWIINNFAKQLSGCAGGGQGANCGIINSAFASIPTTTTTGSSLVPIASAVAGVSVRLGLIVAMLYVAMKASDKIAGSANVYSTAAAGWASGKLSSSVAWGGRNTVGRFGYRVAQSETGKKLASGNMLARTLYRGADRIGRSGFDARSTPGFSKALDKVIGVKLGAPTTSNFEKVAKESVAAKVAFAKKFAPNDRQLGEAHDKAIGTVDKQNAQDAYNTYMNLKAQFEATGGAAEERDMNRAKSKYESELQKLNKEVRTKAGELAGVGNSSKYANSLDHAGLGNLGGLFISVEHRDAAAAIRGRAQKDLLDKLKEAVEGAPRTSGNNPGGTPPQGGPANPPVAPIPNPNTQRPPAGQGGTQQQGNQANPPVAPIPNPNTQRPPAGQGGTQQQGNQANPPGTQRPPAGQSGTQQQGNQANPPVAPAPTTTVPVTPTTPPVAPTPVAPAPTTTVPVTPTTPPQSGGSTGNIPPGGMSPSGRMTIGPTPAPFNESGSGHFTSTQSFTDISKVIGEVQKRVIVNDAKAQDTTKDALEKQTEATKAVGEQVAGQIKASGKENLKAIGKLGKALEAIKTNSGEHTPTTHQITAKEASEIATRLNDNQVAHTLTTATQAQTPHVTPPASQPYIPPRRPPGDESASRPTSFPPIPPSNH